MFSSLTTAFLRGGCLSTSTQLSKAKTTGKRWTSISAASTCHTNGFMCALVVPCNSNWSRCFSWSANFSAICDFSFELQALRRHSHRERKRCAKCILTMEIFVPKNQHFCFIPTMKLNWKLFLNDEISQRLQTVGMSLFSHVFENIFEIFTFINKVQSKWTTATNRKKKRAHTERISKQM